MTTTDGRLHPSAPDNDPHPSGWPDLAAGTASVASFGAVLHTPPAELTGAELVDAIVASEKLLSAATAAQMRLLTEFARPGRAGPVGDLVETLLDKGGLGTRPDGTPDLDAVEGIVRDRATALAAAEVAAALRIAPQTAGTRIRKAIDLCEQLPGTLHALSTGRIDRGRAMLIAERTAVLTPDQRAAVEQRILPLAENRSAGNLRGPLDRAVITIDPAAAEEREQLAHRDRDLTLYPLPNGMASLKANAPAAAAVAIFTLADLLAGRLSSTDQRPVAARRVDAWADIADQLLTHGYLDLSGLLDTTSDDTPTTPDTHAAQDNQAPPAEPTAQTPPAGSGEQTPPAGDPRPAPPAGSGEQTPPAADARPAPPAEPTDGRDPHGPDSSCGGHETDAATEPGHRPAATNSTRPPSAPARWAPRQPTGRWATRQGRRPHLSVTLSASTLAGLDRLPGHLDGYGTLTAATALLLARSARSLTTVLIDPATGAVRDVGTRVYRPRQTVRDIATTLAEQCRFPSCRQPSWRCDLDHRDPFDHQHPDHGGTTTGTNLDPLCRLHHLMKHRTGWTSTALDGQAREWVSPTGHHYTDPPRELTLPDELLTPTPLPHHANSPDTHHPGTATPDGDDDQHNRQDQHNREDQVNRTERVNRTDRNDQDDRNDRNDRNDQDDEDDQDIPDWREAEFGGAFPHTGNLKTLNTIARRRIHALRDQPPAPPDPELLQQLWTHHDQDQPTSEHRTGDAPIGNDPDEPPF